MESALSSWDEVGSTVLPQVIDEMELHLTDASQLSSMQARVVSALARGSEPQSAARGVLEQWVLDGEIQRALELLKQQSGAENASFAPLLYHFTKADSGQT